MRELAESFEIVGHHEHLSEFYRMLYLAILAPYIFPSVKTLLAQPKTLARLLWSPYNAPIADWIGVDPNRTRYADVLRLYVIGSGWTSTRLNRW
jgi:dimethylaniline monooxygenase (N-oxide forming)